jgi:hypothetical protein
MSEPFKGTINVDIRDSVPDWTPGMIHPRDNSFAARDEPVRATTNIRRKAAGNDRR